MRHLLVLALVLVGTLPGGCGKKDDGPRKLKKMDFKVSVDDRGRMLPQLELFDDKHSPIVVEGSYTLTLSRPDGTVLCSVSGILKKEDFNEKKLLKPIEWQDAACPPDPAADELRVALEVKSGDAPDSPKLSRDKKTPTKFIYPHLVAKQAPKVDATKLPAEAPLAEPPPATGSGSAAGSGSASSGSATTGSASGSGSAK